MLDHGLQQRVRLLVDRGAPKRGERRLPREVASEVERAAACCASERTAEEVVAARGGLGDG